MYTYCPDCSSVYEIAPEQLGAAGGLVRCGNCDATFSALRRLTETPPRLSQNSQPDAAPDSGQAELDLGSGEQYARDNLQELGMEVTANGNEDICFPSFENEDSDGGQGHSVSADDLEPAKAFEDQDSGGDDSNTVEKSDTVTLPAESDSPHTTDDGSDDHWSARRDTAAESDMPGELLDDPFDDIDELADVIVDHDAFGESATTATDLDSAATLFAPASDTTDHTHAESEAPGNAAKQHGEPDAADEHARGATTEPESGSEDEQITAISANDSIGLDPSSMGDTETDDIDPRATLVAATDEDADDAYLSVSSDEPVELLDGWDTEEGEQNLEVLLADDALLDSEIVLDEPDNETTKADDFYQQQSKSCDADETPIPSDLFDPTEATASDEDAERDNGAQAVGDTEQDGEVENDDDTEQEEVAKDFGDSQPEADADARKQGDATDDTGGAEQDPAARDVGGEEQDDGAEDTGDEEQDDATADIDSSEQDAATPDGDGEEQDDSAEDTGDEEQDDATADIDSSEQDAATPDVDGEEQDDNAEDTGDEEQDDATADIDSSEQDAATPDGDGEEQDDSAEDTGDEEQDDATADIDSSEQDAATPDGDGEEQDDSAEDTGDEEQDDATADIDSSEQDAATPDVDETPQDEVVEDAAGILTADVDGTFDTELDDEHDYRDLRHYLKPGKSLAHRAGEAMILLLLIALLGVQFIHHNRAVLATHPDFGRHMQSAYKALGQDLNIALHTEDYRVARHTIVPDAGDPNRLMARATIVNNSSQPRPPPLVRLELRNRWGDAIFARTFTAGEYLQHAAPPTMPGNGRLEVILDIFNPTDDVDIGYSFDICVAGPDGTPNCGKVAVFQ